ncbi:MAG: hypothetical protein DMF15_11825 [Verrucomicrobia bacterium]|nr:MAG: hypothetical protein DMF15_11825 [Verrucomicrobiota bacterium]
MAERGGDYEAIRQRRVPTESSTRANAIRRDELPLVPGRAEARPSKGNQIAATTSTQLMTDACYR